jgi:hypothetical protein
VNRRTSDEEQRRIVILPNTIDKSLLMAMEKIPLDIFFSIWERKMDSGRSTAPSSWSEKLASDEEPSREVVVMLSRSGLRLFIGFKSIGIHGVLTHLSSQLEREKDSLGLQPRTGRLWSARRPVERSTSNCRRGVEWHSSTFLLSMDKNDGLCAILPTITNVVCYCSSTITIGGIARTSTSREPDALGAFNNKPRRESPRTISTIHTGTREITGRAVREIAP